MVVNAFIPARGGSKRIPGKNTREFVGVPALGRVISTVRAAEIFDRVIVSTDSPLVATVASDFGAEVLSREESLADDHSGLLDVVQAHIASLDAIDRTEVFACVLPTALLMSSDDLQDATHLVLNGESRFVLGVGRFSYPIQRALRLDNRREVSMVWPENYRMRSQDLDATYHDAGQFYVGDSETWMTRKTMFDSPAQGLLIDDWRVQDIDDEEDWLNAELLWRLNESK